MSGIQHNAQNYYSSSHAQGNASFLAGIGRSDAGFGDVHDPDHDAATATAMGYGPGLEGPSASDFGLLDGGGMMSGMDLDLSLPMDLDMDLSQVGVDNGYGLMTDHGSQHMNGASNAHTDQIMGAGSASASAMADECNGSSTGRMQEMGMTGIGAGPLPTGWGMPAQQGSSTLTEFTKRRNWSQRVIEELKDFLHILTPDGRILYVSPSCKAITGHESHALVGKFIGEFVHPDDSGIFMREFNESIASGNSLRFFYRFKKDDGTYIIFECDGHPHISTDPPNVPQGYNASMQNGSQPSGQCRGFFMMARPYPTKNAALLDSFLEHKIENERLMKRIKELKREEQVENVEQDRLYREQASQNGRTPSESQAPARIPGDAAPETVAATPNYQGMPPPAKPSISNTALTRQNLDSALLAQKPDSIADKMSRYEANSTHLESIELMTGLRYRDGERSHGISTGDTSPALIRGDAGIAILLDRDREGSKKEKKKLKVADEYVCADCGTLDSPEWRKGPKGPKTLCNACGLRWAKKEKKRTGEDPGASSPGAMPVLQPPLAPGSGPLSGMAAQLPLPAMNAGEESS
ncbi:hypothetical protein LTR62_003066 [Meristemomyces frigidus]|uniref:White collar-2 n=1 Tax=Meristemomyces frigidus TaxID=1508187 RepID=A0AAN7TJU7_9PEZI|nr:hypothetical protein LTR62_003066 [Meristemomyces frigidus]